MNKTCTKCLQEKPLSEFWADRSKKHGLSSRCKTCKAELYKKYRKERGYDAKMYWKNPLAERERHLKRKYGIDQSAYDQMYADQAGKCAVCMKTQDRAFDVDHCHVTGKVRGLLCTSCNRMLGHSGDNPAHLIRAALYLNPQVAAEVIGAWLDEFPQP